MMSTTIAGTSKIQLPIAKPVGTQHQPPGVGPVAPPQVAVPPPSYLVVNGKAVLIDVRNMAGADIVKLLNTITGVSATIDSSGRLILSGINSIDGNSDLRVILGI